MKDKIRAIISILFMCVILPLSTCLIGCTKADHVNYNIRQEADNFKTYRRVIAINTRTNQTLFSVEGYISLRIDSDGDLNVTIQTGADEYKLFYAHLGNDVTYTCIQVEPTGTTPYAYQISFFPTKEMIEHGLIDIVSTE